MNSWCPYCSVPCKKLCGNDDCENCYTKSFASYTGTTKNDKLKVDCWHVIKNGDTAPRDISLSTNKKYWLTCDLCKNDFNTRINSITRNNGNWCSYCANKTK
jgi:hypothetical protein